MSTLPSPAATHLQESPGQSLLDRLVEEQQRTATRYMPTLTIPQFTEREKMLRELKAMLVEGVDYGAIPGTDKPVLLKPGAEKICAFFGYAPHYTSEIIEDWDGKMYGEPLFYYKYTCTLAKDGKPVGEGQGSCNSWESKYRHRWVQDPPAGVDKAALPRRDSTVVEFDFAISKAETGGQYGKPKTYWDDWAAAIASGEAREVEKETRTGKKLKAWVRGGSQFRVLNDQFADIINTVQKMGQKRAMVAACLSATGASQYFTQDLEDIDTGGHPVGTQAAADAVRDRKLAEGKKAGTPATPPSRDTGRGAGAANATAPTHVTDADMPPPRPVPEELRIAVELLRANDYSALPSAKMFLEEECAVLGIGGTFTELSGRLATSGKTAANVERFMLDVWDAIIEARRTKEAAEFAEQVNA